MTRTAIQSPPPAAGPSKASKVSAAWTAAPPSGPTEPPEPALTVPGLARPGTGQWVVAVLVLVVLGGSSLGVWFADGRMHVLAPEYAPLLTLAAGLVGAGVLAVASFLALRSRARWIGQARQHFAAMQTLHRIAAAMSNRPDAGPQALVDLAEAARALLGMDRAAVLLLHAADGTLEMVASAGDVPDAAPHVFRLADLPACRATLESGRVLVDGDLADDGAGPAALARAATPTAGWLTHNPDVARLFRIKALVLIPLQVEGRRMGLLSLSDSQPRRFPDTEKHLAALLGAQASLILAGTRLYRDMRAALDAQRRLVRQRDALSAVNAALYHAATLDDALRQIARLTPPVLDADACAVLLAAPDGEYELAAATPPVDRLVGARIGGPHPLGAAGELLGVGKPQMVADAAHDAELHPFWRTLPDVGSILGVPLFGTDGQALGVLALLRRRTGAFTAEQVDLTLLFAARAAVAIENARLLGATRAALAAEQASLAQRDALWAIHAEIEHAGTLQESLQKIADLAPAALGADFCGVNLTTALPDELVLAAMTGGLDPSMRNVPYPIRGLYAEQVLRDGQILMVPDAAEDPRANPVFRRWMRFGSVLYIPLVRGDGSRLGLLGLNRERPGGFTPEQVDLAKVFSARATGAIERAHLQEATRAALDSQRTLSERLDALWLIHAQAGQAATLNESLGQLTRLAPRVLEVDVCSISLCTGGADDELALAAVTGDIGGGRVGVPYSVRGMHAGDAMRSGRPLMLADARHDEMVVPQFRQLMPLGSLLYLPLVRADGKRLGLMVLIRHEPAAFDADHLKLAEMFATRAAGAVGTAQLIEQTRRDAETRGVLLRELNHRVKNNLAGIVGLLSIGEPPEMTPPVRAWLDRAVERIRVMAGAHELFVAGAGTVGLPALVAKTLSSLSVANRDGVEVRTDLDAAGPVALRTEQAVSVAIVLHELCYNALVHGLGDGRQGTLTLRARDPGTAGELAIDVIDDGRGVDLDAPRPAHSTGVGLELVRGLVQRELRGRLSLGPNPGGGTVATVQFPMTPAATSPDADAINLSGAAIAAVDNERMAT